MKKSICTRCKKDISACDCYFYGSNNESPEQEANRCTSLIESREYKYIRFVEREPKPKTKVFSVESKNFDCLLGFVKWHAPWRRYCFFVEDGTFFDADCLRDIQDFINNLMIERRKK